jgi:hypothetical protein
MAYTGPYPFTNTGSITAMLVSNTSFSGNVVNDGTISSGGIRVLDGTINGQIKIDTFLAGGISLDHISRVNATGPGINGIEEDASTFTGGVTNAGTITSASLGDISVNLNSTFSGGITNTGTLSAKQTAIRVASVSAFAGGISNIGTITAGSAGIAVSGVSTFSGGITNAGTISSKLKTGILVSGVSAFTGGITNTGTISGFAGIAVVTPSSVSVFDSGTINSSSSTSIYFNSGSNTLTLGLGYSINGLVLGAGNDTLQLSGPINRPGHFDLNTIGSSAQFRGFTTFGVISGDWELFDTFNQVAPWIFASGADVAVTGSFTSTGGSNAGYVQAVGKLTLNGAIVDTGLYDSVNGGTIIVNGAVTGSGTFGIFEGSYLVVASGGSISGRVNFDLDKATLELDTSGGQVGVVGDFFSNDIIYLPYLTYGANQFLGWSPNSNGLGGSLSVLRLTPQFVTITLASMNIAGGYSAANFSLVNNDNAVNIVFTPNADVSSNTTAIMLMDQGGTYEVYDIGNNAILGAAQLTQTTSQWQVAGLGDFSSSRIFVNSNPDTADMMMRNSSTGAFAIYDFSNNNITAVNAVGQVGLEWSVAGFADFSDQPDETDMLLRNTATGAFQLYDISGNQFVGFPSLGQVGPEWSVSGFGDFSGNFGETDMLMRNSNTGAFELYDIVNNTYTGFHSMGQVGLEWSVVGIGHFSGNFFGADMLMRNTQTGAFEIYDITNNNYAGFYSMGQVGLEWSVVGIGAFSGNGASDLLMRNSQTGAFELYDIRNNNYAGFYSMGQIGPEWSVAGIGTNAPTNFSAPAAQMAQAIASLPSSGAGGTTPAGTVATDPSQQTLLTTPQPG